ncbi:MAG: glycosyltransferase family 1 protein [Candidatus Gracilibacteria bacterium]|nr:glycosyltransferase family 1 protein [Candidatus Gracilibacteria bacterium]
MRIGIDTRMYSPKFTGIGRYVKELIDHITKLDTENEYILFFNDEEYSQYMAPNARVSKRRVKAKHYSLAEQTSFTKALNTEELDLVHFTHFNAPILYKKPSIVTLHDLTLTKFPDEERSNFVKKFGYQMTIKNIVQKAKRIITVSANTKEDTVQYLGAKIEKIKVIYEGVGSEFKPIQDAAALSAVKQKYGITKPFFLYVGAWRKHKNLVMLVKAFNLFKNSHGLDYQLVIAGGNQDQNSEVLKTIQDFGLKAHIVTPGYIDDLDLPALYSAATAFTFPSLYEGFGLPILESMACGTATLLANSSSMPEVAGQDNAIFFDPNSMEQIAENMYKIVTDEALRTSLEQKGLERAKQFTWQKMAEQTLAIYKEVGAEIASKTAASPPSPTPTAPTPAAPVTITPPPVAAPKATKQAEPPKAEIPEE